MLKNKDMKYNVEFYRFFCNHHGYYVQRDVCEKTEILTRLEIIELMDCYLSNSLRHKKERFEVHSTDMEGNKKDRFDILSRNYLLICSPIKK